MKNTSKLLLSLISIMAYAAASDYKITMNSCSKPNWEPEKVKIKDGKMIIRLNEASVIPQVYTLNGNKLAAVSYLVDDDELTLFAVYPQVLLKNDKNPDECSYDISLKNVKANNLGLEKQLMINQQLSPASKTPAGGYVNTTDY